MKKYFLVVMSLLLIVSCTVQPKPIELGKYNCDFCDMTVSDARFAAELLTKKGKVYIFDDLHCMLEYAKEKQIKKEDVQDYYVCDFSGTHPLIKCTSAFIFKSDALHSPMGGNYAAFATEASMYTIMPKYNGEPVAWSNLIQ